MKRARSRTASAEAERSEGAEKKARPRSVSPAFAAPAPAPAPPSSAVPARAVIARPSAGAGAAAAQGRKRVFPLRFVAVGANESCDLHYRRERLLGEGRNAKVYLACVDDDCRYALKEPADQRDLYFLDLLQDVTPRLVPE